MLYLIVHIKAEIVPVLLQMNSNWQNLQNPWNIENDGEEYRWQHVRGDQARMTKLAGSGVVAEGEAHGLQKIDEYFKLF